MKEPGRQTAETTSARLAHWICDFAASPMPAAAAARARLILLDTLGCALYASREELARPILQAAARLGASDDCTIIGSQRRASLPATSFANGALIRLLDLNDSYFGPRQVGHPSDNIGAALASAEHARRSGQDLLQAIRLGYEIYGRLLDLGDPESPYDHVTASGIVTAAITGWLLRLPVEKLAHAIALAATHTTILGEVRIGKISGAKSTANAVVVQSAALLTLLAEEGLTGPAQALEGRRGYSALILQGADFAGFFDQPDHERLFQISLKQYPCFALGQGPISAAIELSKKIRDVNAVEKLTISLANTGPARLRLSDEHGRLPTSSEAADHSIYFLVAVALAEGRFGLDQLRSHRWQDEDIRRLMARIEAKIDPSLQPATALPCRLEATISGVEYVIERPATPGSAAQPLSWDEVVDKFRTCARGVLPDDAQRTIIDQVAHIEAQPSLDKLVRALAAPNDDQLAAIAPSNGHCV